MHGPLQGFKASGSEGSRASGLFRALRGGSLVVTSSVICRVTIVMTYIRGLITPLITTHEPPSRASGLECFQGLGLFRALGLSRVRL